MTCETIADPQMHDYDLPAEWPAMSDEERSRWMTQERARRQALRQATATAHHLRNRQDRLDRRADARSETVDVDDYR